MGLRAAEKGYYEAAVGKNAVFVRAHGLASMNNCLCVRDFIDHMLDEGHNFLIIDLADCTGMDSTFMGLIAGAATYDLNEHAPGVAIVNANRSLQSLIEEVGITEFVLIESEPFEDPNIQFIPLPEKTDERERLACIVQAHQKLIPLSEQNEKVFGPLLATIEAEMKQKGLR